MWEIDKDEWAFHKENKFLYKFPEKKIWNCQIKINKKNKPWFGAQKSIWQAKMQPK
jgi:hypothetical protein